MAQRVKGQETEVIVTINGAPQSNITAIKNFEFSWQLEMLQEGYLNETTDRFDTVFKGVKGKFDMHIDSLDVLNLIQSAIDRARRRVNPDNVAINIKSTYTLPNGRKARVTFARVEFGEIPWNAGGRTEYVQTGISFGCSDAYVARV